MTENKSFDVRLVYLAIHHIIKHRGHFLLENYDLSNQETSGFDESYIALTNAIKELLQKEIPVGHAEKIQIILKDKSLSKREKTEKILQVWDVIKDKQLKEVVQLICGGTANLSTLFMDESLKEALKVFEIKDSKISFSTAVYEEKESDLQSVLEQRFDLVYAAKMLYDWSLLAELMGDRKTLSEAKIAIYETHKKDLEVLKRLTRQDKSLYRKLFRGTDKDSYSAYVGSCMIHGEKLVIEKRGSTEEFYKFLKKEISKLPDCEDKIYVLSKIEAENFLPKAVSTINGIIPYQLQEQELDIILKKAEQYLPFLMEKDAYGTISEKIKQLLTFRIPFYVGPLNRHSDKSWAVHTDKEGRILPWNFNERINEEKSAEKFITRMTNKCTYLLGKDVLPKNSLLYTEYMLFNELNNVKIGKAGTYLTEEQKEKLWKELFLTTKKVTLNKFSKFLIKEGIDKEEAVEIKGLDGGFKSSLAPWIDLKNILGEDFTRDKAEEIIKTITLFSMDKKILKKYLMRIVSEPVAKQLSKLRYTGWGRFSKEFLTEITPRVTDDVQVLVDTSTGEIMNIITALKKTSLNLMEILSSTYGYSAAISEANKELVGNTVLSYETVKELTVSPAVKRPIWQTLKIIKEITHIMGAEPARIFIEMARDKQPDKGRTDSRKKQLIELYKKCKEDVRSWSNRESKDWVEEIESKSDSQLRSNKLFLYYTQMGKCMYTGKPIDLGALLKGQLYDRDHIYPQSQTKDDSLDNLVIVDNTENRDKSNTYPLSKNIREKQIGFWKLLRDKGFISKEKYFRLTRNTPFSDAEKAEFIARQLVETRQSTKAVAEILKRVLPKSIIVYVKAGLTSRFRQYGEFIKVRDLNDYHHAKDAYLNIVTGNVHYTKFTSNPIRFVKDCQIYSLNEHALYKYPVERNGIVAWAPNEEGMMPSVTRWMNKNNILVTRMSYVGQGELFDQLPLKKGKGQVSLKKEGPISDISKYGGYNSASTAYFMYVEGEDNKGKPVYVIETMPLHMAARLTTLEEKQKYCEELWLESGGKLKNPKVLIEQIPIQSLFNVDGFRMTIAGKTGPHYTFKSYEELILNNEHTITLKAVLKFVSRKKLNKESLITSYDHLEESQLLALYDVFLDKLEHSCFSKPQSFTQPIKVIKKGRDIYIRLSLEDKCQILSEILHLFQCNATLSNLTLIKGPANTGKILINKKLPQDKSITIIYQSVTGFYEQYIPLAPCKKS